MTTKKSQQDLFRSDPAAFRAALMVDCDGAPRRLGDVLDPWQRADFAALDSAWQRAIGLPVDGGVSRGYLERPRGHSKTSDLAVMCCWALSLATRPLAGVAAAADRDQARLLRDAIDRIRRLNKPLEKLLDVQAYRIVNPKTGSTLDILSSDAPTSYGLTPDFIICDELTHWQGTGELWTSLASAAAKRANCLLLVISNAGIGMGSSWQWAVREACRQDPAWHFSRLDGPQASWITPDRLAEQRRLLPAPAFDRLWLNRWTTGAGDALSEPDITAAVRFPERPDHFESCWQCSAGLDLGLSRDASALAVIAKRPNLMNPSGIKRLIFLSTWKPRPGERVAVEAIEEAILDVHRRFGLRSLAYDPWQSQYLAERLRKVNIPTREVNFTAKNLQAMATALTEAFSERLIELWDDAELLSDLRGLRVVEKQYGWRLEPTRDGSGHGDRAIALTLALLGAEPLQVNSSGWGGVISAGGLHQSHGAFDVFGPSPRAYKLSSRF